MSEALTEALSPAEQAFFDSKGETAIPAETQPNENASQEEAPVSAPAETQDGSQPRDEKGKFVPHGAFHEERVKRQQLEKQLAEMSTKQAVLEDRWNTILKAGADKQDETAAPPSPEDDIFGFMKWQADQIKAMQSAQQQRDQQEAQQRQATEQDQAVWSHWQQSRAQYAQTNKEFDQAAQWLSDYRMGQLKALGVIDPRMADEGARNAQINAELRAIIMAAQQQGRNPAELVHQLAVGYGFKAGEQQQNGGGAQKDLSAQVDALGKAIDGSKTLTASGGKSASDPMTPESIANMSEAEFSAWIKEPANERRFRQIMGG